MDNFGYCVRVTTRDGKVYILHNVTGARKAGKVIRYFGTGPGGRRRHRYVRHAHKTEWVRPEVDIHPEMVEEV